jgi:hypothetical protein
MAAMPFTYNLQVEVVGPNFMDDPVKFGTPSPIVFASSDLSGEIHKLTDPATAANPAGQDRHDQPIYKSRIGWR